MAYEYKKPQSFSDPNSVWNNEGQAYDGDYNDQTTAADSNAGPADQDPWINFSSWQTKGYTYTETILYVNWKTNGLYSDDQFAIRYTKDGGTNWFDLVALGLHNETTMQTSQVALDANQDLSQVQVKLVYDRVKGADSGITYVYDIWTRGEYTPPAEPPGTIYLVPPAGNRTQISTGATAIKIDPATGRRGTDTSFPKYLVRTSDGKLQAQS